MITLSCLLPFNKILMCGMVVRQGARGNTEKDMIAHKSLQVRTIATSKWVAGSRIF